MAICEQTTEPQAAEIWVIIELMGHRRLAGRLTEQTIAGASFLRLDMPGSDGQFTTQLYSPSSVYCITPTTEEIVRRAAPQINQVRPVTAWELKPTPKLEHSTPEEDDDIEP